MALHSSWAFILFPQVLLQTGEKLSTYFDKQQIHKRKKKFRTKEFCNTLSLNSDSLVSRFCFQSFMHFIYLSVIFSLCSFWEIDLNRHLYRPNEHLARIRKVLIPQGRSMLPVSLLALVQQPQRQVFSRCRVSSVWKLHSCTIRKVKQNKTFMLSLSFFT